MKVEITNFKVTSDGFGYVASFDADVCGLGLRLGSLTFKRRERHPQELWLVVPRARVTDVLAYRFTSDRLRRAIGEAAAAHYREETGIDARYVAPGEKGPDVEARRPVEPVTAGVRRVLGVVEETMIAAGL